LNYIQIRPFSQKNPNNTVINIPGDKTISQENANLIKNENVFEKDNEIYNFNKFTKTYLDEFKIEITREIQDSEIEIGLDNIILMQMRKKFNVTEENNNKIPDYVYSTSIMALLKENDISNAYSLLIRAYLEGIV